MYVPVLAVFSCPIIHDPIEPHSKMDGFKKANLFCLRLWDLDGLCLLILPFLFLIPLRQGKIGGFRSPCIHAQTAPSDPQLIAKERQQSPLGHRYLIVNFLK
jgi:hypothetical protein